jgi:carotenoid cleavage dioxygenase-like enzyme
VAAPRMTLVHDFAATDRYAVVILQAAHIHGMRYMSGLASFAECL